MTYLITRPPLGEQDIHQLIHVIQGITNPFRDGRVLSTLVLVCYHFALKRKDLIGLTIGDAFKRSGEVRESVRVGEMGVVSNANVTTVLQDYRTYLRERGYSRRQPAPLFPTKDAKRYEVKQLQYDLQDCFSRFSHGITLEMIRQAGICGHYERKRQEGVPPGICFNETVRFARITPKQTIAILTGRKIPTGHKEDPFYRYWRRIESIPYERFPTPDGKAIAIQALVDEIAKDARIKPNRKNQLYCIIQQDLAYDPSATS
jgi:hypothetical protein